MPLEREHINPPDAPAPLVYSHAVRAGELLFVSGQLPLNEQREIVGPGDIAAQTRQALENITTVLAASGATWADVTKINIFIVEIRGLPEVREVREAFYAEQGIQPPATTAVGVTGLSVPGALIEIEAYAVVERAPDPLTSTPAAGERA